MCGLFEPLSKRGDFFIFCLGIETVTLFIVLDIMFDSISTHGHSQLEASDNSKHHLAWILSNILSAKTPCVQTVKIEVSKTKHSWFGLVVFHAQGFYYQRLREQTISSKIIQDGVGFSLTPFQILNNWSS